VLAFRVLLHYCSGSEQDTQAITDALHQQVDRAYYFYYNSVVDLKWRYTCGIAATVEIEAMASQKSAAPRPRGRSTVRSRTRWILPLLVGGLLVISIGIWFVTRPAARQTTNPAHPAGTGDHAHTSVSIPHLHGLSFSADGRQLIVPAHDGLRIYADGAWSAPDPPAHDYMGYASTDDGFYSSGHPAPGSSLINPLGLVKSSDGGETLTQLGFAGESDFHGMAVGYHSHAIYVINPAPNSRLAVGMHYSLDEGKSWQQSAAQGVTQAPIQLAVHPTNPAMVALATEAGLLLSTDHGNTFNPVDGSGPVTAVVFSPDGNNLLYGGTTLSAYDLAGGMITPRTLPALDAQDALSYMALNPAQPEKLALATVERHIYHSVDGDQTWTQIAHAGEGMADP
jgi:hypothetical protein